MTLRPDEPKGPPLASWTRALNRSALQDLLVATARPDVISFALGLPSADLFPTGGLGDAIARILAGEPRALQYGPPSSELRGFVARLMRRRGVSCEPEQVFLTAGAQQGMSFLARLLLEPGASVVLESCSYTGFHQAIAPAGARHVPVPTSLTEGMDVEAVARALAGSPRPSLIYAMSDGHNPTGASMTRARRERLAALARAACVPVIEDDAYGTISYDDEDLPALRAFDPDWVFYLGSFSKTLAPALRTGWIVAPERFMGPLASLKESSDIDTATLGQRAAAAFVASGTFDAHLAKLCAEYRLRRDTMLEAIARSFPKGTRWTTPRAGFFTWVELDGRDTSRLFETALASERVAFLPGAAFAAQGAEPARSSLRLNFSFPSRETIEEGIARLARAIERMDAGRGAVSGAGRPAAGSAAREGEVR